MLDSWFARNESEHNLNDNSTEIAKTKLIEQITWLKEKINTSTEHPYKNISDEELKQLPTNNLNMMVEQITNIYMKDRLNQANDEIL